MTSEQVPTRSRAARLRKALRRVLAVPRWVGRRLSEGIPAVFVAVLAAAALAAALYTVASQEPDELTGYAEFTMFPRGCAIESAKRLNVLTCDWIGQGLYRLRFSKPIDQTALVATRSTCCPGPIAVGAESDRTALVRVGRRVRRPIRAAVFAP